MNKSGASRLTAALPATVALAGVAVLAVAVIAVLDRQAPRAGAEGPPAAAVSRTPSTDPATDPSRFPAVHDSGGDGVERGPKHAVIGTPYPFDLMIHCGIRYADFSGAWWQADPVQLSYRPKKQDWRSLQYARGIMTLVGPNEARFDVPDEGLHVTFRPLTTELELCG